MSFGKGSNVTTQTSAPNPAAAAAYNNVLDRAGNVANTPYTPYGGELVAGVNQQQNLGIGGINQNANYAQPYIGQAAQYANNAAQPISASQIAQYQSPYTQQVVNATQAQFNNQNAQQQSALTGNAAAQGALGGDRVGVAQAILAGQQSLAQAPVIAGLENQGFQNAEQLALTQQQAQANAAYSLGNLGVAGQQAALSGAGAQIGAGSLQQQTQQALDAAQLQQFYQAQAYPFQTTQWLAGIDTGVGSQLGGTSTTTAPPPNPWNTILGLGVAGAGLFTGNPAVAAAGAKGIGSYKGGRIRGYDAGGGIGGLPYTGVSGYVPTIQITGGQGAPKPPGVPKDQGNSPLGNFKSDYAAGQGLSNLWSKYGPQSGPLDLTGGFAGGDGIGSLQDIGSAPAMSDLGAFYRDGGAVRHFEDGGLALAGYGTGSVMPDDLPGWSSPASLKGVRLDRMPVAPVDVPSSEPTAVPTIPVRKPTSIGDAELPPEITTGASRPVAAPDDESGALAYAPTGPGGQGLGAAPDEPAATAPTSGGILSRIGASLSDPDVKRSLLAAGFGLMASKSPFLGQAIGEAGLAGVNAYSGIQQEKRQEKKTEADIQHGKDQLAQAAKLAQDRLKAEQGHWTQQATQQQDVLAETRRQHDTQAEHQKSVLEETRRQHDMALRTPVNLGADPRTGLPIMALPRPNPAGGLDYYMIGPNGQISDTPIGAPHSPASPTLSPGPTSAVPSSPANASVRTAALDPGTATDAMRPGEGIIQHNQRVAQAGPYNYGTDAPYIEKGMEVPEPAPLAGKSVQALKTEAEYYLQTSKLPTVAKGNSPVAMVQQQYQNAVKNYANALAQSRGMTPAEVAEAWRTAPGMLRFILGADGRSTVSLGTAVRHLDTVQQLANAWSANDTQAINRIRAVLSREFGAEAGTNLESAGSIVGPEILKAIGVAGAGTAEERQKVAEMFSTARGPDQLKGAVETAQKLLAGQLEGKKRQAANAGVSEDRFKSLIGDRPYEILSNVEKSHGPAGGGAAPAAALPTVKSKAEYDALKPGTPFIDENGKQWKKP